jgi:hypothetical protein
MFHFPIMFIKGIEMTRGKASGYALTKADAAIVRAMQARGDRDHDIAAWFGVNQGRVAEVKNGQCGSVTPAPAHILPPKGAPGVKGRELRNSIERALTALQSGDVDTAKSELESGRASYDKHEA